MHIQTLTAFVLLFAAICNAQAIITHIPNPNEDEIESSRQTALTLSPVSSVKGRTFDRFVQIWLENEPKDVVNNDPIYKELASYGIVLQGYRGLHHPSQPNYICSVGGESFGVVTDLPYSIPREHKTIVDLLESRGISWGIYQEDMPFTGYQGDYKNQRLNKKDYVRKHNPLISYQSVTDVPERLAKIKNFTMLYEDLRHDRFPQWSFITPSMTWDEYEDFLKDDLHNQVSSLLLGDAIPWELHNTTYTAPEGKRFDHYSILKTVEINWDLDNLGKNDLDAEPFWY